MLMVQFVITVPGPSTTMKLFLDAESLPPVSEQPVSSTPSENVYLRL